MLKIRFLIIIVLTSYGVRAQHTREVAQFNHDFNQSLSVRDLAITADGKEAFFTIQSPFQEISQIAFIKKENNTWSEPELMPFSDAFSYLEPFISANGNRLYFVSNRPLHSADTIKKDFDIWYVERKQQGEKWSTPINLGKPVNSDLDEFYPSLSENNNLYFTMVSPEGMGKDDIYVCRWQNGAYQSPMLLDKHINSAGYEFNAFISKKEDFLIFTKYNEADGYGSGDLYISKKNSMGNWEKAENMGAAINTKYMEYCPFYDEQSQLLYFTSKRNDLTPRTFKDFSDLQQYIKEGNNGLSKIYWIPLNIR